MQKPAAVKWAHNTNVYEVNLRQYTTEGTFNAFLKELPRLKDMGVHTLWFMPLQPIGVKNRKGELGSYYSIQNYTAINPEYGTDKDFRNVVETAHQMGFKVIIDWVANHSSWDNVWTKSNLDFYSRDSNGAFSPPFLDWSDVIKLNYDNPELRKAMIDAMKFWVDEFDIDGFRCDMAHLVDVEFWREARKEIDEVKPLFWLGEFDELDRPKYGEVFDASYSWTWMHRTEEFYLHHLHLDSLITVLKKYDDLGDSTMRVWFTTNHDENSWNGTEYEKYGEMTKALAVFSITWNGIPLIYSGQELPNTKRLRFFEKDTIGWTGNNEMANFYQVLLTLRTNNPALLGGDSNSHTFWIKTTDPKNILAYLRKNGNSEVLIVINLSSENDLHFDLLDPMVTGNYKNIFSGAAGDFSNEKKIEMKAWEFLVYEK